MYTPPHSPFKSSFKFKSSRYAGQKDEPKAHPFNQLPTPPLDEHLFDPISTQSTKEKRISRVPLPVIRARTFPTATSHARGTSDPGPPTALTDDSASKTFHVTFPFVYAGSIPEYHLSTSSPTGELRIRKLSPRDTRAHSVPDIHHDHPNALHFRNQEPLFTVLEGHLHGKSIHGPVCISTGSTLWHKPLCKIWQGEPGSKHLLWSVCVGKGVWEDNEGREYAREVDHRLEVNGEREADVDLLVGCWIMRIWEEGDVRLGGN